jgi:hypothetical protein
MTYPWRSDDERATTEISLAKGDSTMARNDDRRDTRETEAGGSGMVPQVLLGAVDGVELVAGGLLRLARSVLLTAVSGAADVGAEALDATVSGARRVVSATSQMVGDVAGTARSSVTETVALARHSGRFGFAAGQQPRRPPAPMPSRAAESTVTPAARPDPTPTRQPRPASRSRRRSAAA